MELQIVPSKTVLYHDNSSYKISIFGDIHDRIVDNAHLMSTKGSKWAYLNQYFNRSPISASFKSLDAMVGGYRMRVMLTESFKIKNPKNLQPPIWIDVFPKLVAPRLGSYAKIEAYFFRVWDTFNAAFL